MITSFIKNSGAKILALGIFVAVLSFVLGPAVKAAFVGFYDSHVNPNQFTHGFGYGYGYDGSGYGFGYGYGYKEDNRFAMIEYGFPGVSGKATSISVTPTATTATFNYYTNYLGKAHVRYSLTTNIKDDGTSAGVETSSVQGSRSVLVSGLTCNTTYYYEVYVMDIGGIQWPSGTLSFTTASCGGGITIFNGNTGGGNVTPSVGTQGLTDQGRSGIQDTTGCQPGYAFSPINGNPCYDSNSKTTDKKPFLVNLERNMVHPDVLRLQNFLNTHGAVVAPAGLPGSLNNETTFFGPATLNALVKYQSTNGISPARGYFGPITRAFVNALLGL